MKHRWTTGRPRILTLGDSYTIGEGVQRADSWPWLLVERLRGEGVSVVDPDVIATTGWTTSDLVRGIAEADPQGPYGAVTLLIGVNDQYQGRALEAFGAEFEVLLDRATDLAAGAADRVVVVSIPDWGAMPHADGRDRADIARDIDAFNGVARQAATGRGIVFIDITDLSREALARPRLVADDGLHPSAAMYRMWVDRILPVVRAAIT